MHTHTFWSDGGDFPESAAKWYKDNGYDFLVFTDHNILLETPVTGQLRVSYKLIEGEFMLMMGNEITDQHAVHLVAIYQDEVIPTVGGSEDERADMIREIVSRVDQYRERTGRKTYPALAHLNFRWAITAEMILEAEDLRYFEVYNGHPSVNNEGDEYLASTERIWDIVLSRRLSATNGKVLYGLATDDTHRYHSAGATPGREWVMVRSSELKEESILDAIDRSDFYSSTGVIIAGLVYDGENIRVEIEPQEGVSYTTEYIGTLSGADLTSKPTLDGEGNEIPNTTRTYSDDIGEVLASSNDLNSIYTFNGNELYVRIKITSSADQVDQITGDVIGKQVAWVQPLTLGIKSIQDSKLVN